MRECEIFSSLRVPCGSKIVVRIDGRKFSNLSHDLGLEKPYDEHFKDLIIETSKDFFKEFSPTFIYTFSDEINILLAEVPFGGRIEKLDSVFASFIAGSFTKNIFKTNESIEKPISFDSRIIPLQKEGIVEYFKERQDEAWRNCMNGYAYWTLRDEHSKKEAMEILRNKKSNELHDILFKKGTNLAELPAWQRRGIGIYKKEILVEGYNPIEEKTAKSIRKRVYVDYDLPIFDVEFFDKLL